ncbi:MAG: hypothetical protein E6H98_11870 [Chloroflexi bacterium]|nr:MAG: hypothetical protein E6I31_00700 [Chloroflexota bacterium]TMG15717.1 MAG: hypothetical protein E6H98_11870 [Chloroflexota bacterium]
MSSSMAKKNPDYAPKSPRGRPHDVVALVFDYVEDAIHVLVAALLVIAGGFVLWSVIATIGAELTKPADPLTFATKILDKGLVLFIIAELLHTVRVTIQERTLVVEPFLIVGLIAGVRRLLLVTAQAAEEGAKFQWNPQGIEISVLLALVLGITVALILWRRFYGRRSSTDE